MEQTQSQSKEDAQSYVDINICPETLTLYYLHKITKIDLLTLVLLFEKLGTGLYYLFNLLTKRKISFPSEANILKAVNFCEACSILNNDPEDKSKRVSDKDKYIFKDLLNQVYDGKFIRIEFNNKMIEEPTHTKPLRVRSTSDVKDEYESNIKKYIRKERRRLIKIDKLSTLYTDENFRHNFVEKLVSTPAIKAKESSSTSNEDAYTLINRLIEGYMERDGFKN